VMEGAGNGNQCGKGGLADPSHVHCMAASVRTSGMMPCSATSVGTWR